LIERRLLTYLDVGGFPEVQTMSLAKRVQTLQDHVELVLLRDVVERHRIENTLAARAFARALLITGEGPFCRPVVQCATWQAD
jgi:hypothetical protein